MFLTVALVLVFYICFKGSVLALNSSTSRIAFTISRHWQRTILFAGATLISMFTF